MNICLIGYGRMGREIEAAAVSCGHRIVMAIDKDNLTDLGRIDPGEIDVAIEFTTPETAFNNIARCLRKKVPVVCGTTGWLKDYQKASDICIENGTSFIHSSNFSIGVNILFRLNSILAEHMSKYKEYIPFIEEIHHTRKLDSPSGTAITLAGGISEKHHGYDGWRFDHETAEKKIPVRSVREGAVPGIHTITWDSEVDAITLRHESKSRKGLAMGALIAAEFIQQRKGVFTMSDVLGF
ncbi:MAG: 4-hydroxy-tetrahydrodipicolinate reductase [Bacteroidales bacterium]|nr:4-hydroxy-tetrahydrodipicolinate reductase [Bacteroidales bacterium]